MKDEDIRKLVQEEILNVAEEGNLPIQIYRQKPSKKEVDKEVEYTLLKKFDDVIVYLVKKAGKAIAVAVFLVGLYETMYLCSEFLFPNTLPSAQQLVHDARQGILHVSEEMKEERQETERFILVRESWLNSSSDVYIRTVGEESRNINSVLDANDIHMFPASGFTGISGDYITSAGNA